MKSDFNQETGEGLFSFSKAEVFEALSVWCQQKGINLKDKQIKFFDCSGDPHFVLELGFDTKKQGVKNATSTQKPAP
jgi:hypothetical protein